MTVLRDVLIAVRAAPAGSTLQDVARDVGLAPDDVAAMVDYWVQRGELVADEVGGCPPAGCAGCRFGRVSSGCGRIVTGTGLRAIATVAAQGSSLGVRRGTLYREKR